MPRALQIEAKASEQFRCGTLFVGEILLANDGQQTEGGGVAQHALLKLEVGEVQTHLRRIAACRFKQHERHAQSAIDQMVLLQRMLARGQMDTLHLPSPNGAGREGAAIGQQQRGTHDFLIG